MMHSNLPPLTLWNFVIQGELFETCSIVVPGLSIQYFQKVVVDNMHLGILVLLVKSQMRFMLTLKRMQGLNVQQAYTILRASPSLKFMLFIFGGLKLYLVYYLMSRKKNKIVLMCDIDDQYTKHIFASKGTQSAYVNLNLQ